MSELIVLCQCQVPILTMYFSYVKYYHPENLGEWYMKIFGTIFAISCDS